MRNRFHIWCLPVVVILYWLQLFNQLRYEWTSNPQYGYGWFVPLLAAGIFWRRWQTRPAPAPAAPSPSRDVLILIVVTLLAALIIPIRISLESVNGWRPMLWAEALIVTTGTLLALWLTGGRKWLQYFLFPVLFLLISVPWPDFLESVIIQQLMRNVAAVAVEVMAIIGVPALRHGATIQISTGTVGVDEACSGVRSLQTAIMLGLVFGEFYSLRLPRRLAALAIAVGTAIVTNVGRTSFLTWAAARYGLNQMNRWHDTAGESIVFVTLAATWGAILLLRENPAPVSASQESSPTDSANPPATEGDVASLKPRFLPLTLLLCFGLFVPASEALNEVWYRQQATHLVTNPNWSFSAPAENGSFQNENIAPRALETLRCNASSGMGWIDNLGTRWHIIYLQWASGNKDSRQSTGHLPEECLTGVGWKLTERLPIETVRIADIELPFLRYIFEVDGKTAYVFVTIWTDRYNPSRNSEAKQLGRLARMHTVFMGERDLERRKIEIAMIGPDSPDAALEQLKTQLPLFIHPQPASAKPKT